MTGRTIYCRSVAMGLGTSLRFVATGMGIFSASLTLGTFRISD